MDDWLAELFLFGVTPAVAVAAVWAVFQFLKDSLPLKQAILETLTNPERAPVERLREQYQITRDKVIGPRFAGWKRLGVAIGVMLIWSVILTAQYVLAPYSLLGVVSWSISNFAGSRPLTFSGLLFLTAVMLLAVIQVFDFLLTATIFRRPGVILNGVLLALAYESSLLASSFLASIYGEAYLRYELNLSVVPSLSDVMKMIGHATLITYNFGESLTTLPMLLVASIEMLFKPFPYGLFIETGVNKGNELVDILFSHLALLPLLMLSVVALTILNVAYFVGLLFVRIDYWYREKYKIDQTKILEDPVEYVGRIACCVAVVAVLAVNIGVWLAGGLS